jgi:hypothetical protein
VKKSGHTEEEINEEVYHYKCYISWMILCKGRLGFNFVKLMNSLSEIKGRKAVK